MKNLFSKSLMMAAAAMMFVSCSNEEDVVVNPYEGKTSDVTIAMSVAGVGSKSSATDVNMGDNQTTFAEISNVVVVPMVTNAYQTPIKFGNFAPSNVENGKTKTVKKTLTQTVNRFKVFGNATLGEKFSETKVFAEGDLVMSVGSEVSNVGDGTELDKKYFEPHALYYYLDTKENGFSVATGTDFFGSNSWTDGYKDAIGTNNLIKISGVNYAVGVLATLVKNGDSETMFYDADGTSNGAVFGDRTVAPLTVTGITIAKQTKSFDANFDASGEKVNVYETATKTEIYKDASRVTTDNRHIANIYSVVAPTTDEEVTLNIEFTVADNTKFTANDGTTTYEKGDKLYLTAVVKKSLATNSGSEIFEADKATFLNLTVKDWGAGLENPGETTDATIGVEFDVTWGEGLVFDLDI